MENNANGIPSDLLIKISTQFNVSTDCILGISDVKRDYNGQYRMNQEMDKYYDIVIRYQNLTEINQKTLRCLLECLEQAQKDSKEIIKKEDEKMLRIAICDDDLKFACQIESLIFQESQKLRIRVETEVFSDGKPLLNSIHNGDHYHLIFIDIEMELLDGITTARHIREIDRTVLLIYISGYDKYLKELFEVEPFRFLSKPLNQVQFAQYFKEAYNRINEIETFYQFTFNKEIKKVPIKDIVYFESNNRIISIHLKDGSDEYFYGKLNHVEKELMASRQYFLRIHQSFLVNYSYIKKMNFSNITICFTGKEIQLKISEDRQKEVRQQLCTIVGGKVIIEA